MKQLVAVGAGIVVALLAATGGMTGSGPSQPGISLDFAAPAANACLSLTDSAPGALANDKCVLGPPAGLDATVSVFCFISAANTVTIKYCCNNGSSACSNPAAQTYTYGLLR